MQINTIDAKKINTTHFNESKGYDVEENPLTFCPELVCHDYPLNCSLVLNSEGRKVVLVKPESGCYNKVKVVRFIGDSKPGRYYVMRRPFNDDCNSAIKPYQNALSISLHLVVSLKSSCNYF